MASVSRPLPPPLSSTNHLSISTTTASFPHFFVITNNKDSPSTLRRRRFVVNVPPVVCSASNGGQNHSPHKVDRRDMLIGLAVIGGGSALSHNSFAFAVKAESPLGIGAALAAEIPSTSSVMFPITLNSSLRLDVPRPKKKKEDDEEILVISGIELDGNKFVKFDVFINDEDDPVSRPDNTVFAGSFVNVPQKHTHKRKVSVLRISISELLEDDLDADDDDSVIVTLVPRAGTDGVTIGGIEIELAI